MSSVLYAVYCIYMGYTALIYFRFIRILPIFYICYERMKGWLNNKVAQYCSLHVDAFLQSVALQRFGLTLSVSRLICFVVLCTRKSQLLPHWIVYKQAIRTLSFMVLQPAPTRGGGQNSLGSLANNVYWINGMHTLYVQSITVLMTVQRCARTEGY